MDKSQQIGFIQGVAWAVATSFRNGGLHADQLWDESGLTKEDLAMVEPYDATVILTMLRDKEGNNNERKTG